ncbi:hypothetical protein GCM10011490_04990 [Pseudoclavibacter endophyticus]|uniref:Uncharacterized protein n=1 Tax=Pseudoclavibacter endophyticus TaxID=1778590 RepID=A0A6H9WU56_9MICO|nr:hypothetical protein [Pseudoclavibacter endophyticus]KAB1649994.1 hypothetical protein F8O04_07200 [Pseudoclavibacter endophyticus]GGA58101.1 hypothetical protein GCM10011490_04990 [Pseudoclavibacter endophyticus]
MTNIGDTGDDPINEALAREAASHEEAVHDAVTLDASSTSDPVADPGDMSADRPDTPPVKTEPTD